jgi:hypothetical protein
LCASFQSLGLVSKIGGLIAHCILFWGPYVKESFKQGMTKTQPDPHWKVCSKKIGSNNNLLSIVQAMQRYEEVPWWWYAILLVLSFLAGKHFTCNDYPGLTENYRF